MFQTTVNVHIFLTMACFLVGFSSYCAFGNNISEIIMYDLPAKTPFSVITQIFYMLNIVGTFVLMA